MPYEKGHVKMGGRKKGTPNKTTAPLKTILSAKVEDYIINGGFDKDLKALDPASRLSIMSKYCAFILPKPSEVKVETNAFKTIDQTLAELAEENEGE